ncbi:hypothetical protein AGR4B_pAt10113 [Agrobacterium tumefaciens str. CFBP 5621]|nr:hypothetical protein AGR4B_pAt10113 [Agrobacterium tumefaciens str. CFBP 5621]
MIEKALIKPGIASSWVCIRGHGLRRGRQDAVAYDNHLDVANVNNITGWDYFVSRGPNVLGGFGIHCLLR